jgi:SAM-dependent methyltransferase
VDRCEVCRAEGVFVRHDLREMLFGLREHFTYLECSACGVLRIETVPTDLARHYPPEYFEGPPEPASSRPSGGLASQADRLRNERILFGTSRLGARLTRRWAPPVPDGVRRDAAFVRRAGLRSFDDPILDVGAGPLASQLLRLQRDGFRNLTGIDPFLERDMERNGIALRRRSIHEMTGSFQLITMHHSFEHVPDPSATLASAARLLRPSGTILIRTPVKDTWFWATFGDSWWELDPPRHLFVHTQRSIAALAREAGLEVVETVWDSSFVEILASQQIQRDIAWREPNSWRTTSIPAAGSPEITELRAKVAELNAAGQAGRAGFYLRFPPAGPAARS